MSEEQRQSQHSVDSSTLRLVLWTASVSTTGAIVTLLSPQEGVESNMSIKQMKSLPGQTCHRFASWRRLQRSWSSLEDEAALWNLHFLLQLHSSLRRYQNLSNFWSSSQGLWTERAWFHWMQILRQLVGGGQNGLWMNKEETWDDWWACLRTYVASKMEQGRNSPCSIQETYDKQNHLYLWKYKKKSFSS